MNTPTTTPTATTNPQNAPPPAHHIGRRSLLLCLLLSIITLGLYGLWWIHALARDLNTMCAPDGKRTSGLIVLVLLSIITLGIYSIFWWYGVGERLYQNAGRFNLKFSESGTTIVLWQVLGSLILIGPLVALFIVIKNTNALADAYNKTQPAP